MEKLIVAFWNFVIVSKNPPNVVAKKSELFHYQEIHGLTISLKTAYSWLRLLMVFLSPSMLG
jgi:hypothetical protein